jgi:hypothetical protein
MKVHSALQEHLNNGRGAVGRSGFQLANVMPYRSLYVQYCSKKRDKAQCEAADDDCEYRAAVVHMSFGRDPYVQGAHAMLASKDPLQAKLLSMYLGQVQMVARGDDMRGRRLKDLGTRTLSCVGEWKWGCIHTLQSSSCLGEIQYKPVRPSKGTMTCAARKSHASDQLKTKCRC